VNFLMDLSESVCSLKPVDLMGLHKELNYGLEGVTITAKFRRLYGYSGMEYYLTFPAKSTITTHDLGSTCKASSFQYIKRFRFLPPKNDLSSSRRKRD
jgi:hypothetical protein